MSLTIQDIQKAINALSKYKRPPEYDENGDPCYSFRFYGTKEEYEAYKAKLSELENMP